MSKWRAETAYLGRYTGSGVLNTLVGFSVIFIFMALGVSPILANIGGYLAGLILGFFLSKKLVFRSEGHITSESLRYLAAFLACFILNLFVLQSALSILHLNAIFAQLLAAATYTITMYLLSRFIVFRAGIKSSRLNNVEP
ncbi:MAG: GtrA family protein [Gallionella sp.]